MFFYVGINVVVCFNQTLTLSIGDFMRFLSIYNQQFLIVREDNYLVPYAIWV